VLRSAVMGELVGGVQFLDHGGKFSEFSSLSSVLGRILLSTTLYFDLDEYKTSTMLWVIHRVYVSLSPV